MSLGMFEIGVGIFARRKLKMGEKLNKAKPWRVEREREREPAERESESERQGPRRERYSQIHNLTV